MSAQSKVPYRSWANTDVGLLENQVPPGVGYEIPAGFAAWGKDQAEVYGAARVPASEALAEDCGPYIYIDGGVGVRKNLAAERAARDSISARRLVASEQDRKEQSEAETESIRDQMPLLVGKEDDAIETATFAADEHEGAVAERDGLSFAERGLIKSKKVLIGIEAGAVAFDCALLHAALEYSGAGSASVWLTSVLAPAAIAGIHVTFGTVAGWIAREVSDRKRLKAAVGSLTVGFGVLLVAFLALSVFREAGIDAMNQGLAEVASGDESGELNLFVSSLWMFPLQVAASISAILAVALWVVGQPGRDADEKVTETSHNKDQAELDLERASTAVDGARDRLREAKLSVHRISVEAREAEAENEGLKAALALRLNAEDSLGHAVKGQYKATYAATDRIYDNGGVVRAAIGDEKRRGTKVRRRPSRDVSEQTLTAQNNGDLTNKNDERAGGRFARRWFS